MPDPCTMIADPGSWTRRPAQSRGVGRPIIRATLVWAACALLGACASAHRASPWVASYEGDADGQSDAVRVEAVPFSLLAESPELAGYKVLGVSRFTDERQEDDPFSADGPLASHAKRVGATLVRIAFQPAGQETRTQYVRTTRPGTSPPSGNIASARAPEPEVEEIAIDRLVDVYEHIAVFYRPVE